ncbi:MAG TPA: hypothetical protein VGE83_09345 [Terracidiphilus sp.]|jgi:hypothetical protein
MPRSVQISTPWPSHESLIGKLRIPKARQKELLEIMDEAWREAEDEEAGAVTTMGAINWIESGKKRKSASAA